MSETRKLIKAFEKELNAEILRQLAILKGKIDEQIEVFSNKKKEYESELSSMGMFSFAQKKKTREKIELMDKRITRLIDPQVLSIEEGKMRTIASQAVDNYKNEIENYLQNVFQTAIKNQKRKQQKHSVNIMNL